MKHIFKLTGSLILDQFVGIISGCMMVLPVVLLNQSVIKNGLYGYLLAFIVCFGFYTYTTYRSAFQSGFRDHHRIIKDKKYRGYWYKGLIGGLIAMIPLLVIYIFYRITGAGIIAVYFQMADMYWTWPMINILPNHKQLVMILAFVPMIIIPWIGYIAGYKNFLIVDALLNLYRKFFEK